MKKGIRKQFCVHGHDTFIVGRFKNGQCKECNNFYSSNWSKENIERSRELKKKWDEENSDKRKACSKKWKINNVTRIKMVRKIWNKEHQNSVRESRWKSNGIINPDGSFFTSEDYDKRLKLQDNKCAICGRSGSEFKRLLDVDHDHQIGIVRGILCSGCNIKLGHRENIDWNRKADIYLQNIVIPTKRR
jgi:hypothetical protein